MEMEMEMEMEGDVNLLDQMNVLFQLCRVHPILLFRSHFILQFRQHCAIHLRIHRSSFFFRSITTRATPRKKVEPSRLLFFGMSLVPTVTIEARRHELEVERLKLDEHELRIRKERLQFEEDELTFRRRVLDYQCTQYFGAASMKTLSEACKVVQITSNTASQEDSLQIETTDNTVPNRRVQVWWRGDKCFYKGEIVKTGALIQYDDGDAQWESDYESDHDFEQKVDIVQCKRTPGCPKAAGHVGRCPGVLCKPARHKRLLCQLVGTVASGAQATREDQCRHRRPLSPQWKRPSSELEPQS